MTETQQPAPTSNEDKELIRRETTADGRYIPYGGGLMGWFENSGVMNNERGNNYKFHTVIDADSVRRKLFERSGTGGAQNRRASKRHEPYREIAISLEFGGQSRAATTSDYSIHGVRIQIRDETLELAKGQDVTVKFFRNPERTDLVMEVTTSVMWTNRLGKRLPVWNVGLSFKELAFEKREELMDFFES